ncbi:MAG: FxsA family protein, partial [Phyllobacterium sp.]
MRSFVPLFLLALPFLEIAGFIVVGSKIGVLATLGLIILAIF